MLVQNQSKFVKFTSAAAVIMGDGIADFPCLEPGLALAVMKAGSSASSTRPFQDDRHSFEVAKRDARHRDNIVITSAGYT